MGIIVSIIRQYLAYQTRVLLPNVPTPPRTSLIPFSAYVADRSSAPLSFLPQPLLKSLTNRLGLCLIVVGRRFVRCLLSPGLLRFGYSCGWYWDSRRAAGCVSRESFIVNVNRCARFPGQLQSVLKPLLDRLKLPVEVVHPAVLESEPEVRSEDFWWYATTGDCCHDSLPAPGPEAVPGGGGVRIVNVQDGCME